MATRQFYVRQCILFAMRWLGVLRLCRFFHRHEIVILMIHGVMDERGNPIWRPLRSRLPGDRLEEYLRVLSRRYHFVSLKDAVDMLQGRRHVQAYSIVLTFDDGYRNNFTHALPVLRRFNAPATFFVCTGFINDPRPFWFDRLDYALQQGKPAAREARVGLTSVRLDDSDRDALRESYRRFRHMTKQQEVQDLEFLRDVERLSKQLESESGRALADVQSEDDWSAIITWEQARKACDDGINIGSHTVDHIRLPLVDAGVAQEQLARSKRDIERNTGRQCLSLCYPNGAYTDKIIDLARDCGYVCAVTTREGLNRVGDDCFKLRRIHLAGDWSSCDVLARLSGLSQVFCRMKAWLLGARLHRVRTYNRRGIHDA